MTITSHCLLVSAQLAVLLLSAAGWGYWFYVIAGRPPLRTENLTLCAMGGLCGGWLGLQDLVYAGVRLAWSSWFAAGIAGLGLIGILWAAARGRRAPRFFRHMEILAAAGVALIVFYFQGSGVISAGARDYYGYGEYDQVSYVQLGQFLVEKPFATTYAEVGLHPWIVRSLKTKGYRIGQSVANAYTGVITGTDTAGAYGSTSVFFVALMASAVFALLRSFPVPTKAAFWGALWAGFLPGITQNHLEGFLSETSILFVLPSLVLAMHVACRSYRLGLASVIVLLTFLMSAFSEMHIIGVALVLALAALPFCIAWRKRSLLILAAIAGPPLILAPYVMNALGFVTAQYRTAGNPNILIEWAPYSGTWRGWSQLFLVAPAHNEGLVQGQVLAGFAFLALIGLAVLSRSRHRRIQLATPAVVLAGALIALLSAPALAKYPFAKLLVCFSPVAVAYAVLGLCRLQFLTSWFKQSQTVSLPGRVLRTIVPLAVAALAGLAAWSSSTKLAVVYDNGSGLRTVNTPNSRDVYRELDAHPERRYLMEEGHPFLNSWFCYHARHSEVYTRMNTIFGEDLRPLQYAFQHVPPPPTELWAVSNAGVKRVQ